MLRLLGRQHVPEPRPPAQGGIWQVPERFNFTRDVVEAVAVDDPSRPALTFVNREGIIVRLTFRDVAVQARQWAALFRSRGLNPGDRVIVVVGKTPAWHAVLLGALKAGLVAVPCSELLRPRDLAFRGEDTDAQLVVTDLERAAGFAQINMPVEMVVVEEVAAELRGFTTAQPTHDTSSDDIAFILYTSGTSGDPKGALHTHGYTWANRFQAQHWLDARRGDLVWCTAGAGSAKAIWNVLLGPWSCGAEIVLHDGDFDPEERLSIIGRLGVTVLCQAPTEYRLIAKLEGLERFDLSRLRHAVSAGEPLNPELIAVFRERLGLTIHDGYGQAENTVLVANTRGTPIKPGSMGLPTPGHDVSVIDDEGNEQPVGIEGEIALEGRPPSLFRGYWNAPEETGAVLRGRWFLTGDRAIRDEDGYLWFAGRADDVIVSAAHRIGPAEVESALLEHPAVAESAVVGKPDPDRGEIVKAFIVLQAGFEQSAELALELQEHVKEMTAPYVCPREIEFVSGLPQTSSGKTRRVELRERERSLAHRQALAEALAAERAREEAQAEARRRADEAERTREQYRAQEERRVAEARAATEAAKVAEAAAQARREAARRRRAERAAEKRQRAEEERRAAEAAEAAEAAAQARREAAKRRRAERAAEKKQRAEEERRAAEAAEAAAQARREAAKRRRAERAAEKKQRATEEGSAAKAPPQARGSKGHVKKNRQRSAGGRKRHGKERKAPTEADIETNPSPNEEGTEPPPGVAEPDDSASGAGNPVAGPLEWRALLPEARTTSSPAT